MKRKLKLFCFVLVERTVKTDSLKCLYGQQGFYSYGSSILCKKVF